MQERRLLQRIEQSKRDETIREVFEAFQQMVENPDAAKILGAVIGKMGPKKREKFNSVIKELVTRVKKRAVDEGVMYWEKKGK